MAFSSAPSSACSPHKRLYSLDETVAAPSEAAGESAPRSKRVQLQRIHLEAHAKTVEMMIQALRRACYELREQDAVAVTLTYTQRPYW
jgi:hypothetical protein